MKANHNPRPARLDVPAAQALYWAAFYLDCTIRALMVNLARYEFMASKDGARLGSNHALLESFIEPLEEFEAQAKLAFERVTGQPHPGGE